MNDKISPFFYQDRFKTWCNISTKPQDTRTINETHVWITMVLKINKYLAL